MLGNELSGNGIHMRDLCRSRKGCEPLGDPMHRLAGEAEMCVDTLRPFCYSTRLVVERG